MELALPAPRGLVPVDHHGALRALHVLDEELEVELLGGVHGQARVGVDQLGHQQGGVRHIQPAVVAQVDVHDDVVFPGVGRGADGGHIVVVGRAGDVLLIIAPGQAIRISRVSALVIFRYRFISRKIAALALHVLGQVAHAQAAGLGADHPGAGRGPALLFSRRFPLVHTLIPAGIGVDRCADVVPAAAAVARLAEGQIGIVLLVLSAHVVPAQHIAVGDAGGGVGGAEFAALPGDDKLGGSGLIAVLGQIVELDSQEKVVFGGEGIVFALLGFGHVF